MPTSTTLKSIDPTNTAGLILSLTSAAHALQTATEPGVLIQNSKIVRGAQASLSIISAQQVLSTATNTQVEAEATSLIFDATVNLNELNWENNLYDYNLSRPANIIYFALFTILFFYFLAMSFRNRYTWFNVTFTCGYCLEFMGFLGRILAFTDWTNINYFLLQFVCLTIAPAFIMAGIYFTFGQLIVIHGRQYSRLKPMWYTYLFITCDVLSLVIQAIGGGIASKLTKQHKDAKTGTNIMIAGIAFQVIAMTVFLFFWFLFVHKIYFQDTNPKDKSTPAPQLSSPLRKKGFGNYMKMLINTSAARNYKLNELEKFYNPKYLSIRARKLTTFYPFAMSVATIVVYIRCVYRVVELAQGWKGYLVTTEVFLMILDALMIGICGIIFVVYHPFWVFGEGKELSVKSIRNKHDSKDTTEVSSSNEKSDFKTQAEDSY